MGNDLTPLPKNQALSEGGVRATVRIVAYGRKVPEARKLQALRQAHGPSQERMSVDVGKEMGIVPAKNRSGLPGNEPVVDPASRPAPWSKATINTNPSITERQIGLLFTPTSKARLHRLPA